MMLALASGGEVTADRVLVATGRRPVTGDLGVEAAGVRLDQRGHVVTDRHLATTARGIYAAQATHAYPTWSLAIQQAAAQFFGELGGRTARDARA